MTKIVEQTSNRLVVEDRPLLMLSVVIFLGVGTIATSLDWQGGLPSFDQVFGIGVASLFLVGGAFLFRVTTTTFDGTTGTVTWRQHGLRVSKERTASFEDIRDVAIVRAQSRNSGAKRVMLLLAEDERWPMSFGFSSLHGHPKTAQAIRNFLRNRA